MTEWSPWRSALRDWSMHTRGMLGFRDQLIFYETACWSADSLKTVLNRSVPYNASHATSATMVVAAELNPSSYCERALSAFDSSP